MIVAINKIDKPGADSMRVKNQLLEDEIVVEDFKGKVPSVEVSAKTGKGIDSLLEIINLVAEVEEIKAPIQGRVRGVVIEGELNHQRGPTATLIVREGTLKINDTLVFSSTYGRIKNMEDFMGREVKDASPGTPVIVVGIGEVPLVGEKFKVVESTQEAENLVKEDQRKHAEVPEVIEIREDIKIVNIILKADVQGTLEALYEVLRGIKNKNDNMSLRILKKSVGEIMESDIKLAATANAFIAGFRTKINQTSENFARQMKVDVILSDIIYELVEKVRAKIDELVVTEKKDVELGSFKVLAIFRTEKSRMILGGRVLSGEIKRSAKLRVLRAEELMGEGRIAQLKIKDKPAEKVDKDEECGILYDGPVRVQVGDILQCYVHI
jgi:translation initiation factor IF-2